MTLKLLKHLVKSKLNRKVNSCGHWMLQQQLLVGNLKMMMKQQPEQQQLQQDQLDLMNEQLLNEKEQKLMNQMRLQLNQGMMNALDKQLVENHKNELVQVEVQQVKWAIKNLVLELNTVMQDRDSDAVATFGKIKEIK